MAGAQAVSEPETQPVTDWEVCARAGKVAEERYDIPDGLLVAIGHIESGRDGPVGAAAWPWALNATGATSYLKNRREAISAVTELQAGGTSSIDVGCYQINLFFHPKAFSSLEQAFDPYANAFYAAEFLASLRARTGSWEGAVAAYHSAELKLGLPYRDRVLAEWGALGAPPEKTVAFGVHIIGPSKPGTAPKMITIGPPAPS